MKASYEEHRERLRNRYVQADGNSFPDYDMIELLRTYAVQRRNQSSLADRYFTTQVLNALKTLDIRLLNHLIVSRTHTFSFLDCNLLEFYP